VVAAARERLKPQRNVRVLVGDMHALNLPDTSFDLALLMQALTYSERPAAAVAEAARLLRPGGRLVVTSLARHEHRDAVAPYGHANLGFTTRELVKMAEKAKLRVSSCEALTREKRPPHFEVLSLHAVKA
jgi:ubiquinone/menaquinone biosynthesis C-methylase UbiE